LSENSGIDRPVTPAEWLASDYISSCQFQGGITTWKHKKYTALSHEMDRATLSEILVSDETGS
jgi:hypothetical protein